jgi:hydrogenase-4 component D
VRRGSEGEAIVNTLLILLIALPFLGALPSGLLAGRAVRWTAGLLALAIMVVAVIILLALPQHQLPLRETFGGLPWVKDLQPGGLFGALLDPLSAIMVAVVTVIGFLVVLYSIEYLSRRNREHGTEEGLGRYYFWLLLFIGSMVGIAIAPNLLQLFIFWEMTTLCSWALISHHQSPSAIRAGYKALIMTHIGGLAFMIALVIVFVSSGSFAFSAVSTLAPGLALVVFLLLLAAAWAKAAQVPFYTWLPDAMEAPTPISAYLHAAAMVKAGVYLMLRVVIENGPLGTTGPLVMVVMASLTMLVAVFFYFLQDDLKRLLAFSTITHLGYILLAAAIGILGSTVGFRGAVLHLACHAPAKGLLFLAVGAIAYATGTKNISDLGGLGKRMPLVAGAFLVGVFAVTGIPPLACFWSKFFILTGALELGGTIGPLLAALVVGESMIAFGWFVWVAHRVFMGRSSGAAEAKDPPWQMSVPLAILILLCVAAPLLALPVVRLLGPGG